MIFKNKYFILFIKIIIICLFLDELHEVLSLVAVSRDYSLIAVLELPLRWLFLLQSIGCRVSGLHSLWCMGFIVSWHMGSSQTRIKPVSPALAGRFPTTGPPGKPAYDFLFAFIKCFSQVTFSVPHSPTTTPLLGKWSVTHIQGQGTIGGV